MLIVDKLFQPALLTAALATYYISPDRPGVKTLVKKLVFLNTAASVENITAYCVPKGGTAGDANMIVRAESLASGQRFEVYEFENQAMREGDFLQAICSTVNCVNIEATGVILS